MGLAVKLLSKEINSSLCLLKSQIRLKLVCTEVPNTETWKRRSPSDSCHPAQDNHAISSTLGWWRGQGCEPGLQSRGSLWRSWKHTLIAWLGLGSLRSAETGGLPLSRLSEQKPLGLTSAAAGEFLSLEGH